MDTDVNDLLAQPLDKMTEVELIQLHKQLESYICHNGHASWDYLRKKNENFLRGC